MTQTTIATEVHQALDVHRNFTAQVTFNGELAHFVTQTVHVRIGQVLHFGGTTNAGCITDLLCASAADAINRRQGDSGMLMVRNVYPCNTGH